MIEKIRKVLKSKGGFTLVELLVVIVVLGILSGIGVQRFGAVQSRANETAWIANHRVIVGAIQLAIFDNGGDAGITIGGISRYLDADIATGGAVTLEPGDYEINTGTTTLTSTLDGNERVYNWSE